MTSQPLPRPGAQSSRVVVGEISAFLHEAAELSADRGASLSRRVAFHERKAELFARLAADEPDNAERQAAAQRAWQQYEYYLARAGRVTG